MNVIKLFFILMLISCYAVAQEADQVKEWTLQECVDYALENNLNVKRSLLNVQSGDIALQQSKMALLPNANANGRYSWNWGRSIDPTTNLFTDNKKITAADGSVSSTVPIFNGFRLMNSIKQNNLTFEASQKDLEKSRNDIIFNVITYYTNVLFNRELLENAKTQLNSTEQQVARTEKQVKAGALPRSGLLDFLAQKATNELNVVNAENNYQFSKIQLKQALQLAPADQIDIVVPNLEVEIDPVLEMTALEIYDIALNSMPEIQGAELKEESAGMGIKVAKGSLYPSLTLTGGLTTRYSNAAQLPIAFGPRFIDNPLDPSGGQVQLIETLVYQDAGGNIQTLSQPSQTVTEFETISFSTQVDNNLSKYISFGLNIPIFNGFQARAGIQRAIINKDQAKIQTQETKYQLWANIEQAYNDVIAASKSYNASLRQVEAREESFRVTKQRYDIGAVNFTDYQIAENDLFQAKSDLVRAKYDYIFKQKVLDFYQGKPLEF